MKYENVHSMK